MKYRAFPICGLFLLALLLAGCGPRVSVLVGLDEAFASSHPRLAAELGKLPGTGAILPWFGKATVIPLRNGPSILFEEARLRGFVDKEAKEPHILVTSPLLAMALIRRESGFAEGGVADEGRPESLGKAFLIVPEWQGKLPDGIGAVSTDREPAYRDAGKAAGSFIASLRVSGEVEATGAIIFSPSADRPRSLLAVFSEAFESAAGAPPLIEELPEATKSLADAARGGAAADVALERLLGTDLRILLVAIGPGGPALCRRAARPGLAFGLDAEEGGFGVAFRIAPDNEGIVRAIEDLATEISVLDAASPEGISERGSVEKLVLVPARVIVEKEAEGYRQGEIALADLLQAEESSR